jgi:DNA replication protein DnaC
MKRLGDLMGGLGLPKRQGDGAGVDSNAPSDGAPHATARRDGDTVCPICKGMGYLTLDVPVGHPDFNKLVPCRCTEARLTAERTHALQAASSIGQLSRLTFDTFLPEGVSLPDPARINLREAYKQSVEFARNPQGWLVLIGGYGCGKTHLAAAIANYRMELGHAVMFVVVPDLLDYLRAAYAPNSAITFDERLEAIRETPLLILDDLGAHNSTPWAQEKLFQILNHRYNGRLPTVITSNQRPEEMEPRIASRLRDPDISLVWEVLASDFRLAGGGSERGGENLSTLGLHGDQTFETFSPRSTELPPDERDNLHMAITRAREFAENPKGWLVFTGDYGCGKTHLAAAVANYQVTTGRAVPMFVVVPDLLDHLRATFSPTSTITLDKLFEQVRSVPLLVLDDLGTESATPWAREKLFQLLNHRYAARLPTVITTSDSIDQIDPRLRSRMLDAARCTVFAIHVTSYRGRDAKASVKRSAPRKTRE